MKILYKQLDNASNTVFSALKISQVYLKRLTYTQDSFTLAKKEHHHTCFEIHIITSGYQTYEIGGIPYKTESGSLLLIPPNTKHKLIDTAQNVEKFSITYVTENDNILSNVSTCVSLKTPDRILNNLSFILNENSNTFKFSRIITENSIFEIIITIFRLLGYKEKAEDIADAFENTQIVLAKQYIKDNIELSPNVKDVSDYCNLSPKQLTRLFFQSNGVTPLEYIQKQKIKVIQSMLTNSSLSLKEISERMHFNNEYYFNAYFKKYAGMPPGEYRAMHQ